MNDEHGLSHDLLPHVSPIDQNSMFPLCISFVVPDERIYHSCVGRLFGLFVHYLASEASIFSGLFGFP